jgi:hypothetical protein
MKKKIFAILVTLTLIFAIASPVMANPPSENTQGEIKYVAGNSTITPPGTTPGGPIFPDGHPFFGAGDNYYFGEHALNVHGLFASRNGTRFSGTGQIAGVRVVSPRPTNIITVEVSSFFVGNEATSLQSLQGFGLYLYGASFTDGNFQTIDATSSVKATQIRQAQPHILPATAAPAVPLPAPTNNVGVLLRADANSSGTGAVPSFGDAVNIITFDSPGEVFATWNAGLHVLDGTQRMNSSSATLKWTAVDAPLT